MADKLNGITNLTYALVINGTKDEFIAIVSCLLKNGPDELELYVNNDNIDEMAKGSFKTQDNEAVYKKCLQVASGILKGSINTVECDRLVPTEFAKEIKESGALQDYKKAGKAGGYNIYKLKEDNMIEAEM